MYIRPLLCFINSIEYVADRLYNKPQRWDDWNNSQWLFVKTINVVNQQLPKRYSESGQRLDFNNFKSRLLKKISQAVL
jgi:hypothetical protein